MGSQIRARRADGSLIPNGPKFGHDEFPVLAINPGTPVSVVLSINGVQNELAAWLAPVAKANDPKAYKPFVSRDDDVTGLDGSGKNIFLLTHKDAPTFKVLALKMGQMLSAAKVLVPAAPDRVIENIHAASDGLYVLARHGAYSVLLRVPNGSTNAEEIALPFKGHISESFSDARKPGLTINLESFVTPPTMFAYSPAKKAFTDLKLGVNPPYDSARYEISDLEAKAEDGVMVPDTLVRPKGASGPQIVLIQAYGSYGISQLADFSPRAVSFLEAGGTYASCHVRGGGELGDAWRLAGKDANKVHTWRDLIACGEDSDRTRLHHQGQALHLRRLRGRYHHGPGADRTARSLRGRDRFRASGQHAARRILPQRSAEYSRIRHHHDRTRL